MHISSGGVALYITVHPTLLIPRLYTRPEVVPDESLGETRGNMAINTQGKVLGCRLYCKAGLLRSRYTFPLHRFVNNKINKHTSKKLINTDSPLFHLDFIE